MAGLVAAEVAAEGTADAVAATLACCVAGGVVTDEPDELHAASAEATAQRAAGYRAGCENAVSPWWQAPAVPLTPRERQIAALASAGLQDQAIAARLHISARTVQTHLAHVYAKLGITSRIELSSYLG